MIIKDIRSIIPVHKTLKPKKRNFATHIVVHTTASNSQDPIKLATYDITPSPKNHISSKGAPTCTYSDFVTKDGIVYHCVDYTSVTWHAGLYNTRSIGIAMAFDAENEAPTGIQYKSMIEQCVVLCLYMKILPKNVIGHREVPGMYTILGNGSKKYKKICPGLIGPVADLDKMRNEITCRLQRRLWSEDLYFGKIDGIFKEESINALKAFNPTNNKRTNWKYNV